MHKICDGEFAFDGLLVLVQRRAQLSVGQPHDGIKAPHQIARLRTGIDGKGIKSAPKFRGHGLGQLRLAHPRLATHQEWPLGRQRRIHRLNALLVKGVKALRSPRGVG